MDREDFPMPGIALVGAVEEAILVPIGPKVAEASRGVRRRERGDVAARRPESKRRRNHIVKRGLGGLLLCENVVDVAVLAWQPVPFCYMANVEIVPDLIRRFKDRIGGIIGDAEDE